MIKVPNHDDPLFRRVVTDQVMEGFTYFRSESLGEFARHSVMTYMAESRALKGMIDLIPIAEGGMKVLLKSPWAGLSFVKKKLEAMYRMLSDLHYVYEFDEFGMFLLNEIIEQVQPGKVDERLARLFPELYTATSQSQDFWYCTRGIDWIRIRQHFLDASVTLLPGEISEAERETWVEDQTERYTDFRRMGFYENPDILFKSSLPGLFIKGGVRTVFETLREGIPGMSAPEVLYDAEGFRTRERILDQHEGLGIGNLNTTSSQDTIEQAQA